MSTSTITHEGVEYKVPFIDLFRSLTDLEEAGLKQSIREIGVQNAALVDDCDPPNILAGYNRMKICNSLGVKCPIKTLRNLSDEDKRKIAEDENLWRRAIKMDDLLKARKNRLKGIAKLRKEGQSIRAIAESAGISPTQVNRDLEEARKLGLSIETPSVIKGKDGRKHVIKKRLADPSKAPPAEMNGDPDRPVQRDKAGTAIPERLKDIFADRWHADALEQLRKIRVAAKEAVRWNVWLDAEVVRELQIIIDRFVKAVPGRVCPGCAGDKCGKCRMSGFLGKGAE